jgi:hypothetical protein
MDPTKSSRRKGVARHPVAPQPSDAVEPNARCQRRRT